MSGLTEKKAVHWFSRRSHQSFCCTNARQLRAFTLVEILIVIGIIGVLLALLMPALVGARRAANTVACASNLRQIGVALEIYAIENRDMLPWAELAYFTRSGKEIDMTWDDLINRQLGGNFTQPELDAAYAPRRMRILECPADDTPRIKIFDYPSTTIQKRSYAMVRSFGDDPERRACSKATVGLRA